MSKVTKEKCPGLRVECPSGDCESAFPQSEWEIKQDTDHLCEKGHWVRIEGKSPEELIFYRIAPELVNRRNLI